MEKVIYSQNGGLGVILRDEKEEDCFDFTPVKIGDAAINPGDLTNLYGLFNKPVRYVGLLKGQEDEVICFHLGVKEDLFEKLDYYSCFYWISETRLFNKYNESSGRDFNLIGDRFK